MNDRSRIEMLKEILEQNPDETFTRYSLGMEYSKIGDTEKALSEFRSLLLKNPDYTASYFMAAQTLARAERKDEAKTMLTQGIMAAQRTGNSHAQSEMQTMLDELELQ